MKNYKGRECQDSYQYRKYTHLINEYDVAWVMDAIRQKENQDV